MLTIPWRTGVNMREFAYYGTTLLPNTTEALQHEQLAKLKQMNVKLVRFYASAATMTTAECVSQVKKALDLIDSFGMQAIVCLDDSLGSGFSVPGTKELHTSNNHYHKNYWVEEQYALPHVKHIEHIQEIVGKFANHRGVLIWELGNEYALHPENPSPSQSDINAFFKFAELASKAIKTLSPQRLVSTGLANSRQISYAFPDQIKAFAHRLFNLPSIDVISVHYYKHDNEKQHALVDIEIARIGVKKPYYIGELGAFISEPDRPGYYHQEIQEGKAAGAFSVLPWAFDISQFDVGVSDDKAMSRRHQHIVNHDFEALCNVVQNFGANVDRFVVPTIVADEDEMIVAASAPVSSVEAVPAPMPHESPAIGEGQFMLLPVEEVRIRREPVIQDDNILGHANLDTPLEAFDLAAALAKVGQQNEWIRLRLEGWSAAWLLRLTPEGDLTPAEDVNIRREPVIQDGNILGRANVDTPLEAVDPTGLAKVGQQNEWIRVRLEGWSAAWLLRPAAGEAAPVPPLPPMIDTGIVPDLSDREAGQQRALDFDHEPSFVCLPVKVATQITSFSGFGPNNFSYLTFRQDRNNGIENGGVYQNLGGLHNGLDFGIPDGTMLCSVDWGVVVHVSKENDDNPFRAGPFSVIIRYGSYLALFGHMLSVEGMAVHERQIVGPGTDIGLSGTGNNFPHLHFEMRNISAAHVNGLRQEAEANGATDVAAHMSQAFNLNNWPQFVPDYVNPIHFFTPPPPSEMWPLAAPLQDVDSDNNGYPDQVTRAGENVPIAYNLQSLDSFPRGIQEHFWQGSQEV